MRELLLVVIFAFFVSSAHIDAEDEDSRLKKALTVFNVVRFPNDVCGGANGFNGTCYTNSECQARGGSASGACASSFGVCCVFSLSCGGTSSANNSYAIINSYNINSDADPCMYTFCKSGSDICKLRIDFTTMQLAAPGAVSSTALQADSNTVGDCQTDTLTVKTGGCGRTPPVICGYNTGQHMWVPASDQCTMINIDIDTGNTGTTRNWQIKVTQYDCEDLTAPLSDCLQYHDAASGTIATFNWDTSSATTTTATTHLSHQYYDICIRRESGKCCICYDPVSTGTAASAASYGLTAGPTADAIKAAVGTQCTGVTTVAAAGVGLGDYVEIPALHAAPANPATIAGIQKVCGGWWNVAADAVTHQTLCSCAVPFRLGVHMDQDDNILAAADVAAGLDHAENTGFAAGTPNTLYNGVGTQGFWLNYWQTSC